MTMINIDTHPVWQGSKLWGKIHPIKKKGHILRFLLARQYAKVLPRASFIGITGSVGKTTTTIACKAVLDQAFKTVSTTDTSQKTVNLDPIFNLPKTILRIRPGVKKVLLEMGIEHKGEMELWLSLVHPATGIITAINYAHSEFLGSLQEIVDQKAQLVEQLPENGTAILNWDDPTTRKLADRTEAQVVYFGFDQKNCHVWASKIRTENFQTVFELNYGVERVEIRSQFLGSHQIHPLLAAATLGINEGISLIKIKKALEKVDTPEHRCKAVVGFNGSVILDDTYNSSPLALEQALETLNQLPARRRIAVLGEMRELGPFSEKLHRQIARKLYKDKADLVITGGGDARYIFDELLKLGFIPERMKNNLQNPQMVSLLLKVLSKGDVVLIKGSRATRLDEVVKKVSKLKSN